MGLTERIDYVQKEFNSLNEKFNHTVDGTVSALEERFEQIFGDNGKVSEVIRTHFGEDGKLVKQVFDPYREGSPMYELRNNLGNEIQNLRKDLNISRAENVIIQKTALKGFVFEDYCEKLLTKIVRQQGDILERTTDKVGRVKHSKKGDFVISVGNRPSCKVVFDMKDTGSLSVHEVHRVLEESLQNRDAQFGVLVAKGINSLPQSMGWFNEYNGNELVCALSNGDSEDEEVHEEILCIAYKWAKSKALIETAKRSELDRESIGRAANKVREKLAGFSTILTQCANIYAASEEIRKIVRTTKREIDQELSSLIDLSQTGE